MSHGKFGTAINCMDGRVQLPLIDWMKKQFGLDYVDMITEPGPDRVMTCGQDKDVEVIEVKAAISARAHGSRIIVIVGHDDCAGNPVDKETHCNQVRKAIQIIRSWDLPFEKIIGVWLDKNWNVEVIESHSR